MPEPPREERCDRCRHWSRLEDDIEDVGVCRRYPPSLPNGRDVNAEWPETLGSDFCGEWAPPDAAEA